jgi:UDP-N-acetylglucosamine 2-epimerase (non-hydrolysing)
MSSANLLSEGTIDNKISFVGNIMIDTLEANLNKTSCMTLTDIINDNLSQGYRFRGETPVDNTYAVMTLHRPSNVDHEEVIEFLLNEVTNDYALIWPIHPRAKKQLKTFGLWERIINNNSMGLLEPVGYHEMLRLNMGAKIMLTDLGGLQEECCVLGTQCLTMRWNTERPVTLRENGGASVLVGNNIERISEEYRHTISLERKPSRPELWDGKTAERCLQEILKRSK